MKAWLAIDSLSDRGAFNAWLRRIGYNTFLSHRRALHPTEDVTEARDIAGSETGDSSFRYQDLYQALDRIPPRERTSIVLYYMEGYSTREIAGITDTTENNVRQQLARGRSHLKSLLTPQ